MGHGAHIQNAYRFRIGARRLALAGGLGTRLEPERFVERVGDHTNVRVDMIDPLFEDGARYQHGYRVARNEFGSSDARLIEIDLGVVFFDSEQVIVGLIDDADAVTFTMTD